jgi:hypothetical protein
MFDQINNTALVNADICIEERNDVCRLHLLWYEEKKLKDLPSSFPAEESQNSLSYIVCDASYSNNNLMFIYNKSTHSPSPVSAN